MAFKNYGDYRRYQTAYYWANRKRIRERADAWRKKNQARCNALKRLQDLRAMKNPLPRHIEKMAEICNRYPKRRIVYV